MRNTRLAVRQCNTQYLVIVALADLSKSSNKSVQAMSESAGVMRKAFERYIVRNYGEANYYLRLNGLEYAVREVDHAWYAWQAAWRASKRSKG